MGVSCQCHAPATLHQGMTQQPLYGILRGPQGQSEWARKISLPTGFDPQTIQPIASCYTDCYPSPVNLNKTNHLGLLYNFKRGLLDSRQTISTLVGISLPQDQRWSSQSNLVCMSQTGCTAICRSEKLYSVMTVKY